MNGITDPQCPFCDTGLTVDHVLWDCTERDDDDTRNMDKRSRRNKKNHRIYEKIGFYDGICKTEERRRHKNPSC
jgi:hypothetical protein